MTDSMHLYVSFFFVHPRWMLTLPFIMFAHLQGRLEDVEFGDETLQFFIVDFEVNDNLAKDLYCQGLFDFELGSGLETW